MPILCNVLPVVLKPIWDIPMLFKNLTMPKLPRSVAYSRSNNIDLVMDSMANQFAVDTISEIVIIVRVHASYSSQMLSMLWSIEASAVKYFKQVSNLNASSQILCQHIFIASSRLYPLLYIDQNSFTANR